MNKSITDVLEYLYKEGKKELADVILREIQNKPTISVNCPHNHTRTEINNIPTPFPGTKPYMPGVTYC